MIIQRRPLPALAPVAPLDGSPQQQTIPLPAWRTVGVSAEVQALTVPGSAGPIAVFATLELTTVNVPFDVVVRLYALTGSQRVLVDQGRITSLGDAETRLARFVATSAVAADSYEVTVQHLTPWIPTMPTDQAQGTITIAARPWTGGAAVDLIAQRIGRLVVEKDQDIFGGKYFLIVPAGGGPTFLRRFTLTRTGLAADVGVAHFWDASPDITSKPRFSVYVSSICFLDSVFAEPIEFTNGLRVSFGKIEAGLPFSNPLDTSASGDDRMIFEVQ